MQGIYKKIAQKLIKMRLQPIRVFCFHQTSEQYVEGLYCNPDWIPTDFLKKHIEQLFAEGYQFISLEEAHKHIQNDIVRIRKYAVITADDGMLCQTALLPWFEERNIPITFFIDLETLDGKTCTMPVMNYLKIEDAEEEAKIAKQLYLTKEQLMQLSSPMLTIGMHGVKHEPVHRLNRTEFQSQVQLCKQALSKHPSYIAYYAYPYGAHTNENNEVLESEGIIPVYADGEMNYNDGNVIHREILESIFKRCQ